MTGPSHAILVGDEFAGRRIFARRCDREHPFALQQLQGVSGPCGPFFFHYGQHLVPEIGFSHVKKRLPRHGRVLHPVFFRHERKDRIHQQALAGGRTRLHDHGKRRLQASRHGRKIPGELIRFLAHHAAAGEVLENAVEQVRIFQ